MRIFMDEYELGWDEAWELVKNSVAYTNHTVMSEALEKWPQDLIQQLLPRIWEIMCGDSTAAGASISGDTSAGGAEALAATSSSATVRFTWQTSALRPARRSTACPACTATFSRTTSSTSFFYTITPERFTYVTNGIDHRRWLSQINPGLDALRQGAHRRG